MRLRNRFWLALALGALVAPALAACGGEDDLGPPVLRYADWDAQAPLSDAFANNNSNNVLETFLEDCGVGLYPCPPYGMRKGNVLANVEMIAANAPAKDMANEDGIFSFRDYYQEGTTVLWVFMTAVW
jgi:hypothetical protein